MIMDNIRSHIGIRLISGGMTFGGFVLDEYLNGYVNSSRYGDTIKIVTLCSIIGITITSLLVDKISRKYGQDK